MSENTPGGLREERAFQEGEVAEAFLQHYHTPRGWMRTAVIQWGLESLVSRGNSLRVADIGCGDARESIWLASLGHRVVAVDPSEVMIDRAQALWSQEEGHVSGSLEFHLGNDGLVRDNFSLGSFDLVLSHGVLMYQTESHAFVSRHAELLRDGGHLSILTKNALHLPIHAASEGQPEEALMYLTERQSAGPLGQTTVAHTPDELQALLRGVGLHVTKWFGVRIFSDHLDDTVMLTDADRRRYLELELATATVDPYRSMAPGICAIARRGPE